MPEVEGVQVVVAVRVLEAAGAEQGQVLVAEVAVPAAVVAGPEAVAPAAEARE